MKRAWFALSILVSLTAVASAQTPIPPFTGSFFEGFEGPPVTAQPCIPYRVFQNTADLCDTVASGCTTTGAWNNFCPIFAHGGGRFFGSSGGPVEYDFDAPAQRFGGWFAANSATPDATASFYDAGGGLLATVSMTLPNDCVWRWFGWDAGTGPGFARVRITGAGNGGGYILMDDMQSDNCASPLTYCTAKANSLNCIPAIGWSGAPSASSTAGFVVNGVNIRNNKNGILFYGVNGRDAAPFQGGFLCVASQIRRTVGVHSYGTPPPVADCTGVFSLDMNSFAHGLLGGTPLAALTVAGTVVDCQWWGRDPGFPWPNNTTLSDALEYTVCP